MDTNTQIAKLEPQMPAVPADVSAAALESALGAGDLSRLSTHDRLTMLAAICQTVGLNPLTKPFDYITLQGKLTLYANKGCAEQLRKIHRVSVEVLERKQEAGCYIVRVKATDGHNRTDEATGVVPLPDNAKGDMVANAMMKAETKAKRRVTLSICGLGMIDESELDTMKEARRADAHQVVAGAETATDRAAALNSLVQPVDAEVVTEINPAPEPARQETAQTLPKVDSSPVETRQTVPQTNPPATVNAPSGAPAAPATSAQQPKASAPSTFTGPDGKLTEEVVQNLEIKLSEGDVQLAMEYIVHRKGIKPGQPLNTMSPNAARFVLQTADFHERVQTWAKNGKK